MKTLTQSDLHVTPHAVFARIRSVYAALTEAEQRVADFIAEHPEDAVYLSVRALAERIGVSEATVIRCSQALGYRGLRDLKLALASEAATPQRVSYQHIAPDDDVASIARKVLHSNIQKLADLLELLDHDALDRAVQALVQASRVEFYGVGSSIPIAVDAAYRFMRIGMEATAITDPYMQLVAAAKLTPGSVAFAISHSGRSPEIGDALRAAQRSGAVCILLSSHTFTTLSQYAEIQLITADRDTTRQHETIASRIAHLSVIDVLHAAVSIYRLDLTIEAQSRNRALFAERRKAT